MSRSSHPCLDCPEVKACVLPVCGLDLRIRGLTPAALLLGPFVSAAEPGTCRQLRRPHTRGTSFDESSCLLANKCPFKTFCHLSGDAQFVRSLDDSLQTVRADRVAPSCLGHQNATRAGPWRWPADGSWHDVISGRGTFAITLLS